MVARLPAQPPRVETVPRCPGHCRSNLRHRYCLLEWTNIVQTCPTITGMLLVERISEAEELGFYHGEQKTSSKLRQCSRHYRFLTLHPLLLSDFSGEADLLCMVWKIFPPLYAFEFPFSQQAFWFGNATIGRKHEVLFNCFCSVSTWWCLAMLGEIMESVEWLEAIFAEVVLQELTKCTRKVLFKLKS